MEETRRSREAIGAAALLILGVGLRLAFAARFPTTAFSDFRALIDFGQEIARRGLAVDSWHWIQFNPGLPMILAALVRAGVAPESGARLATVVATGLLPLLPFFLWRPILAWRWRMLAGALLALWPGQIVFSTVVAQENWALLPTVALGALAVAVLRDPSRSGRPVAAGLLLAAAAAVRQELLVVLAPAALAAAAGGVRDGLRRGRLLRFALALGLPLLALALQRQAATGRFALTTEHGGLALLGSVVPGAAGPGWIDPKAYIASVDPDLLEDRDAARAASSGLALAEWKRRPRFHVQRAAAAAGRLAVESDADDLYWSAGAPQALPPEARTRGQALFSRLFPWLRWELVLVQGVFLAALLQGLRRRDPAILVLSLCVLLKFALQSVASPLGRLMVPAIALELLVVALGVASVAGEKRGAVRFGLVAAVVAGLLLVIEPRLTARVLAREEPPRRVSRFPLEIAGTKSFARCTVEAGDVKSLEWKRVWMNVGPGGSPRAACTLPDSAALTLVIEDANGKREEPVPGAQIAVALEGPGAFSFLPRSR